MDELSTFCNELKKIIGESNNLDIESARKIVKSINEFLFTKYPDIGFTEALGDAYEYVSDFHKYWEENYREILNATIDDENCKQVAEALHGIFVKTKGKAFSNVWDTCGLSNDQVCRIRLLSANQDFRGSRNFSELAKIFNDDNTIFDEEKIYADPEDFVKQLKITDLSQTDKRVSFAKNIADFVLKTKKSPYELISFFDNDIYELRNALINYQGAGYGNKKADMFVRDMVVLGIWNDVKGFENIDVASDVNTIKVALRTGILKTAIPLVSSFLDIFCYQYGYIDEMNANAWRRVWEIWKQYYPEECISSPCLMDYFVYKVVGKQFCKESLSIYKCEKYGHFFKWHSPRNKTCQLCYKNGEKGIKAHSVQKVYPCNDLEGYIAIQNSEFVQSFPNNEKISECPFKRICDSNGLKNLQPPKSISILGQTGWTSAYTEKGNGGGGLMA